MSVLSPASEAELAEMIATARAPLAIEGGGTRGLHPAGTPLSTRLLSGVTLYEPGALTLVAQAGTPLDEIEACLGAEGQRLPFEPTDLRRVLRSSGTPTIGGMIAANASGPRRIAVGAARDFLLGVRFVDGSGTVVKNGGRVMKNVTGYDLVKLMCGSFGTLGVLTEVALKVLPSPPAQVTLCLKGRSNAQAVTAMSDALASPYEVSGAAHDPQLAQTYLRLEGFEASVAYRAERLSALLGGAERIEGDAAARLWHDIRDAADFSDVEGDLWRVSVRPSFGAEVLDQLAPLRALMDWSGGLLWLALPPGTDLRARLAGLPGHATLVRAQAQTVERLGRFHPEAAPIAAISRGLRARFDPHQRLNPGLMA